MARSSGCSARSAASSAYHFGQGTAQAREELAHQCDHAGRAHVGRRSRRLDDTDPKDAGLWREVVAAKALWDQPAVTCLTNLLGLKLDASCIPSLGSKAPQAPAIAIFDSGIDASKTADFGSRIVARANFASLEPDATGDPMGHGTMVAGIAAGNGPVYPGVARNAPLVDVRVAASDGRAFTSDIIAAVDWVLANKSTYNIRVANFSLVGTRAASFRVDPLDKAVEKLWLSGVVVVAAAGNNGNAANPVGIGAPANDPFVITVGALDMLRDARRLTTTSGLRGRPTARRLTAS